MQKFLVVAVLFLVLNARGATNQGFRILGDGPPTPPIVIISTNRPVIKQPLSALSGPVEYVTLFWQKTNVADYYEVWSSVNLKSWLLVGNFRTNFAVFSLAGNPQRFFKVYGHADALTNHLIALSFEYTNDASVVSFNLYKGTNQGIYAEKMNFLRLDYNTNTYTYWLKYLQGGKDYYFRASAVTSNNIESDLSKEEPVYSPTNRLYFHQQMPVKLSIGLPITYSYRTTPTRVASQTTLIATNNIVDIKPKTL